VVLVGVERPWISVQIFAGAELHRVDEQASDDHVGVLAGGGDQR
jgi:hypothetical protein